MLIIYFRKLGIEKIYSEQKVLQLGKLLCTFKVP